LKPENLILTSDSSDAEVKIVDFGFATRVNGFDQTQFCGTIGYIAPEMIRKQPYGKPVDMWAFGVILYILLSGYPPFYHPNQEVLANMIKRGQFQFHEQYWQHVSEDARDLISRLLDLNPLTRLSVDDALLHPWLQQREDVLTANHLTSGLNQLRRFQVRKKFRGAIKAIIMIERMKKFASFRKTNSTTTSVSGRNMDLPSPPPKK
jgi:serine/threonine protein kinase